MKQPFKYPEVISILKESELVSKVEIKTHPHHFHTNDGDVVVSELTGDVIADLKKALSGNTLAF